MRFMSIFARLKEPSSHAGLAAMAALFLPQVAPFVPALIEHGMGLFVVGTGMYAVLKPESANAKD